ncbi:MAG TPA: hypothetical protein VJJ23_00830 [Candidatus Nanoarchaeia archaeon]|nr:hypothetical protein [Candidatus Nanoarchaeia archaeon]
MGNLGKVLIVVFMFIALTFFIVSFDKSGLNNYLTGNAIYDIDYANVNEVTIQIPEKNSVDIIFSSVKRVNLFYDGSQGSVANFRIGNLGVLKFNLGETKRADLDNDGKAETEITFMQIVNKNAEINIKKIESGCLPSWYCEEWDECVNNAQTRTCIDVNGCNNNVGKPELSQSCTATCDDGIQNQNEEGIDCGGSCGKQCRVKSSTIFLWAGIPIIIAVLIILIIYFYVRVKEKPYEAILNPPEEEMKFKDEKKLNKDDKALSELDDYVKEALLRNVPVNEVKENLLDVGWPSNIVDKAISKWQGQFRK